MKKALIWILVIVCVISMSVVVVLATPSIRDYFESKNVWKKEGSLRHFITDGRSVDLAALPVCDGDELMSVLGTQMFRVNSDSGTNADKIGAIEDFDRYCPIDFLCEVDDETVYTVKKLRVDGKEFFLIAVFGKSTVVTDEGEKETWLFNNQYYTFDKTHSASEFEQWKIGSVIPAAEIDSLCANLGRPQSRPYFDESVQKEYDAEWAESMKNRIYPAELDKKYGAFRKGYGTYMLLLTRDGLLALTYVRNEAEDTCTIVNRAFYSYTDNVDWAGSFVGTGTAPILP